MDWLYIFRKGGLLSFTVTFMPKGGPLLTFFLDVATQYSLHTVLHLITFCGRSTMIHKSTLNRRDCVMLPETYYLMPVLLDMMHEVDSWIRSISIASATLRVNYVMLMSELDPLKCCAFGNLNVNNDSRTYRV